MILMASGTEVGLIVEAGARLAAEGVSLRLVSFPSWELFEAQDQAYRDEVLLPTVSARLAVEAGVAQGWEPSVGGDRAPITLDRFGASAPYKKIYQELGFTAGHIIETAQSLMRSISVI